MRVLSYVPVSRAERVSEFRVLGASAEEPSSTRLTSHASLVSSFDTQDGGICQEVHSELLNTDLNESIEGAEPTAHSSDRSCAPLAAGSLSPSSQSAARAQVLAGGRVLLAGEAAELQPAEDDPQFHSHSHLPPSQRP